MWTSAPLAPARRAVLAAGLGALAGALVPRERPRAIPEGPPARVPDLWAADRARGRLWGLGLDLVPLGSLPGLRPVEVVGLATGEVWALEALERGPDGARDLVRRAPSGRQELRIHLGPAHLLGVTAGGDAVVLHRPRPGGERVQRLAARGRPAALGVPGARCTALGGGRVLVGGPGGSLRLLRDVGGRWRLVAVGELAGTVRDVALGEDGRAWALTRGPARVVRLDAELAPVGSRVADPRAAALLPLGGARYPWTVDERGAGVHAGEALRWRAPAGGLEVLRPDGRGGGLAACLGALLHLDPERGWDLAQGGFEELVDVRPTAVPA